MTAYVSHGTVTLPDGRKVLGHCDYWYEWDTNALVEVYDSMWLEWVDTGEQLTADEMNQAITPTVNLWCYVFDKLPAEVDLRNDD